MSDLFAFDYHAGMDDDGVTCGTLMPTGLRPAFAERLRDTGIELPARLLGIDARRWPVRGSGDDAPCIVAGTDWMLVAGAAALFLALFVAVAAVTLPGVRRRRLAKELAASTAGPVEPVADGCPRREGDGVRRARPRPPRPRHGTRRPPSSGPGSTCGHRSSSCSSIASALGAAFFGALLGGSGHGGRRCRARGRWLRPVRVDEGLEAHARSSSEQLPDTLSFIAGALRAGHSLPQAIDSLVHEAQSPTKEEFQRALFETQLGHTLPDALEMLAGRVRSEDFDWVVQAIGIQRDVGGDLAAVLDNVTATIRDRTRIRRQIDTLTAEGRLSALVLLALPVAVFLFLSVVEPVVRRRAHVDLRRRGDAAASPVGSCSSARSG